MREQNETADERHHRLAQDEARKRMRWENEMADELQHGHAQDAEQLKTLEGNACSANI